MEQGLVIYEPKTLTGEGIGTFRGHRCVRSARLTPTWFSKGVTDWWVRTPASACSCPVLDVPIYDSPVAFEDVPFHEMETLATFHTNRGRWIRRTHDA
jgi:hypothetical protein